MRAEDREILLPGEAERPPVRRAERRADAGVAANARLTAANAAVLLVLLAAEGVTVLRVRALLMPHVFIGVVLIPPVLLKVASTGWRFARYYSGVPAYRRKGPPPLLLRLLGPVVVISPWCCWPAAWGCSWSARRGWRCCSRCTRRASCCGSAP